MMSLRVVPHRQQGVMNPATWRDNAPSIFHSMLLSILKSILLSIFTARPLDTERYGARARVKRNAQEAPVVVYGLFPANGQKVTDSQFHNLRGGFASNEV